MRRLQLALLAAMVLIAIAAGPAAMAAQSIASQTLEDEIFFAGLVTSIDPGAGVMTVEEAGSDRRMTFTIPRETPILKDEGSIRLAAIQVGDPVAIEFRDSARGPIAASVKVITSPREE